MRSTVTGSLMTFVAACASWVIFAAIHPLLGGRMGPGTVLLLSLGLGVAVAVFTLRALFQTRGSRFQRGWEELDRSSTQALLAFERDGGLDGSPVDADKRIRNWLSCLAACSPQLDADSARRVLRQMMRCSEPAPEWARLLQALPARSGLEAEALECWNRLDAAGFDPVYEAVDRLLEDVLREGGEPGGWSFMPLVLQRAEAGVPAAEGLLLARLNARSLKPDDLPSRLHHLLSHPALDPRVLEGPWHTRLLKRVLALRPPRLSLPRVTPAHRRIALLGAGAFGLLLVLVWMPWGRLVQRDASVAAPERQALAWQAEDGDEGGFTVQVMASKDSLMARDEVERLLAAGLWSYLLEPRPNSAWYRVRVGRFERRTEADSVATQLMKAGTIEAWYVANFERNSSAAR